jgi:hypothetical protein
VERLVESLISPVAVWRQLHLHHWLTGARGKGTLEVHCLLNVKVKLSVILIN